MTKKDKEKIVSEREHLINSVLKEKNLFFMKSELYDICMIGFVRGLNTYDENKGTSLRTYVVTCMKTAIVQYFHINSMKKRTAKVFSYNIIIDEEGTEMIELIADDYDLEKDILAREDNILLYSAIQTLPKRSREIVCYSYGAFEYPKKKGVELSKQFKISDARIKKIKSEAKNILKLILSNEQFAQYLKNNYMRFLNTDDKESVKCEILVAKNIGYREKEYLLKSLKRNWKEKETNYVQESE